MFASGAKADIALICRLIQWFVIWGVSVEFAFHALVQTPLEVPHRLRAIVRARESSLIMLADMVGSIAGLAVAAMSGLVGLMHVIFFGLDPGERLSGRVSLDPLYAFLVQNYGAKLLARPRLMQVKAKLSPLIYSNLDI
jgi:hypothetical protein